MTADMMNRIAIAGAAAIFLGTAALAQTDNDANREASEQPPATPTANGNRLTTAGIPTGWTARIKSAFFVDGSSPTLLAYDVIRRRWSALSPAERSQVTADCRALSASGIVDNNVAVPDTGTGQTTGDNRLDTDGGPVPGGTGEGGAPGSSTYTQPDSMRLASMKQVCDIVGRI